MDRPQIRPTPRKAWEARRSECELRDLLPGEVRTSHTVPMAMGRRGVGSRLAIKDDRGGSGISGLDPALVKAIARGRQYPASKQPIGCTIPAGAPDRAPSEMT